MLGANPNTVGEFYAINNRGLFPPTNSWEGMKSNKMRVLYDIEFLLGIEIISNLYSFMKEQWNSNRLS
jgi:hypothetical protein